MPGKQPEIAKKQRRDRPPQAQEDKPGTNATQRQPNPKAEPIPGRQRSYHPRSPYTTGND